MWSTTLCFSNSWSVCIAEADQEALKLLVIIFPFFFLNNVKFITCCTVFQGGAPNVSRFKLQRHLDWHHLFSRLVLFMFNVSYVKNAREQPGWLCWMTWFACDDKYFCPHAAPTVFHHQPHTKKSQLWIPWRKSCGSYDKRFRQPWCENGPRCRCTAE